jgi:hypothetical protein
LTANATSREKGVAKAANGAPFIRFVCTFTTSVQGNLIDGAPFIRFVWRSLAFMQGNLIDEVLFIRSVLAKVTVVEGDLINGATFARFGEAIAPDLTPSSANDREKS